MSRRTLAATWLLLLVSAAYPNAARAQSLTYSDTLLALVRSVGRAVPGDLPQSLRYLQFADFKTPLSGAVAGASDDSVKGVYTVFQIRYARRWIMVDAGVDREVERDTTVTIHQDRYQRVQEGVRGANLIVMTHEHFDHVAGVIHTPWRDSIAPRVILTRAQVQTLLRPVPKPLPWWTSPLIHLTSQEAARYLVIDYERFYPVAPGVVLIKAPGHTPGSQMVYVMFASGQELLLIGDIAWFMAGIERRAQKPEAVSRDMGEDRAALQQQLNWLSGLSQRQQIVLVNSHDDAWLQSLQRRGILKEGLDLTH